MIVHSYYDEDPRVRREAEALVAAGRPVDVFGLRRPGDDADGRLAGVRVHRLDVQRHQGAGFTVYLGEYLSFLVRAAWAVTRAHRRRRYGVVQVHSLPDFLVFAALPLKLAGVPVILDLHEAMTELFATRFPRLDRWPLRPLLLLSERLAAGFADRILTVNEAMHARLLAIGIRPSKVAIVPNSPDLRRFDAADHVARVFREDGRLRVVYTGAVTPVYELDVVIDAIAQLASERPDLGVQLDVYGRGDFEPALRARAEERGIADRVTFHGRIPFEAVPAAVAASDIGLAPTRRDAYTDATLSTKLFEYGAMRKPVVATWLPLVERTFGPDAVATYASGDIDGLVAAIAAIADDAAARDARVADMATRVAEHGWARAAARYLDIVDGLAAGGPTGDVSAGGRSPGADGG